MIRWHDSLLRSLRTARGCVDRTTHAHTHQVVPNLITASAPTCSHHSLCRTCALGGWSSFARDCLLLPTAAYRRGAVNGNRWEKPGNSPFVNFWRNWVFVFLYTRVGVSPAQIFRMYYGRHPDPVVENDIDIVKSHANKDDSHPTPTNTPSVNNVAQTMISHG